MVGPHPDVNAHQRRSTKKKREARYEQQLIWEAEEAARAKEEAARAQEIKRVQKEARKAQKKAKEDAEAAEIASRVEAAAARKKKSEAARKYRQKTLKLEVLASDVGVGEMGLNCA